MTNGKNKAGRQSISESTSLGFTIHQLRKVIRKQAEAHIKGHTPMTVIFNENIHIGDGFFEPKQKTGNDSGFRTGHKLVLGTYPYAKNDNKTVLKDEEILKLYGTALHELVHYDQYESHNSSKEDAICEASKHGNICYYRHVWSNMPHEIEAEFKSTMLMMDKMREIRPAIVDEKNHITEGEAMMLERLTDRARNGGYIY